MQQQKSKVTFSKNDDESTRKFLDGSTQGEEQLGIKVKGVCGFFRAPKSFTLEDTKDKKKW